MRTLLLTLALAPTVLGCSSTKSSQHGPEADYVFCFLRGGPKRATLSQEESKQAFAGHMKNIGRLAEAHQLLIAGPLDSKADAQLAGIFIFDVRTVPEAEALVATDPAVQAGALSYELVPMRSTPRLREIGAWDKALDAEAEKAGKKRELMDKMRRYGLVVAKDAARAENALADLRTAGKIALDGSFGAPLDGQRIFVVDAADADATRALLGPRVDALGDARIDTWFAAKVLERLAQAD